MVNGSDGIRPEDYRDLKEDEDEKDAIRPLRERITYLEEANRQVQEELRRTIGEKRFIESELLRMQKEVKRLKIELERMKSPPLIVGSVRDLLDDGRVVVKSSTGPDFLVYAAEYIPKEELGPGSRVALNKQTLSVMSVLPSTVDPIVMGAEILEKPAVTYTDIGGLDEQLQEVREAVEEPLLHPELYSRVGIEPPKGVLLIGPPGTGKTLMAKAIARHTNASFIRFVGSELVQKYIGEGARLVRELFELARRRAPTIVFLDELDAIGAKRLEVATSGDREVQRTLMQLLSELDGFNPLGNVRIIGATNRPDILDEALLRPGRFDRIIDIPMPSFEGRVAIFKIHTKAMNCEPDLDVAALAERCHDASGADIKAICTEAGMFAIRDRRSIVTLQDFMDAVDKVMDSKISTDSEPRGMFA